MKAIGYARISTAQQDLKRQKELIKGLCETKGYTLVDIYEDVASGARTDRSGVKKLGSLTSEDCDIVIISELSRLSRESEIMAVLNRVNSLIVEGVSVQFVDKPDMIYKDSLDTFSIMRLAIEADFASNERMKISNRLQTGNMSKFKTTPNAHRGGVVPIGYKVVDNPDYCSETNKGVPKKVIIIDTDNVAYVNRIFDDVIEGNTIRGIARELDKEGYRTKSNTQITERFVARTLKNEKYIGINIFAGISQHMGFQIVTDDKFKLANQMLSENRLFKNKPTASFNPLRGIAKCLCGYNLMLRNPSETYSYFACGGKTVMNRKGECNYVGTDADYMLGAVWETVKLSLFSDDYHSRKGATISNIDKQIDSVNLDIANANERLDYISKELDSITNSIINTSNLSILERLDNRANQLSTEEEKLRVELPKYEAKITELKANKLKFERVFAEDFFNSLGEEEIQKIYRDYLEEVNYYSVNQYCGYVHIKYKTEYERTVFIQKGMKHFVALLPNSGYFDTDKLTFNIKTNVTTSDLILGEATVLSWDYKDIREEVKRDSVLSPEEHFAELLPVTSREVERRKAENKKKALRKAKAQKKETV